MVRLALSLQAEAQLLKEKVKTVSVRTGTNRHRARGADRRFSLFSHTPLFGPASTVQSGRNAEQIIVNPGERCQPAGGARRLGASLTGRSGAHARAGPFRLRLLFDVMSCRPSGLCATRQLTAAADCTAGGYCAEN